MSLCLNCFISSIITHKLVIYIYIYIAWAWIYLLNKLESKVQAWLIYKPEKKNMNKLILAMTNVIIYFDVESNLDCSALKELYGIQINS